MAKEKPTKDAAKPAKEKAAKVAKKPAATAKTEKSDSDAAGKIAKDAANTAATPVEDSVETPAPVAAASAVPVADPAPVADDHAQDTSADDDPLDKTGESTAGAQHHEPETGPTEDASRRRARPKVQYSDDELEEFRVIIEKTRQEAVEEFQILRQNLEDITSSELADENASYSMHMAEQGTEAQEKEKIYAQVQRLNDYIKKLDEALQRIKEKTYGICRVCGILIAKERLIAVPITTLSASYKIQKKCPEDGIDRIVAPRS